jgi:hypothetical protein
MSNVMRHRNRNVGRNALHRMRFAVSDQWECCQYAAPASSIEHSKKTEPKTVTYLHLLRELGCTTGRRAEDLRLVLISRYQHCKRKTTNGMQTHMATRTDETSHVFNHAQHIHADFFAERDLLPNIQQGNLLRDTQNQIQFSHQTHFRVLEIKQHKPVES